VSRLDKDGKPEEVSASHDKLGLLTTMMVQGRSFSSREKKCCFLNTEAGGRFATISATSGLDFPDDGRAMAIVDWDQDGYPDLWISNRSAPRLRFMHNDHPHTNHFLAIKLQGNGTTTNRDAIGARVEVVAKGLNGKRLVKSVHAGEGFLSQSTKWLHFGLGKLEQIDKIIVHWPAGKAEEFPGVKIDQRYLLVQSSGQAQALPPIARKLKIEPAEQRPVPDSQVVTVPLTTLLPMPRDIPYTDFNGDRHPVPIGQGRPTLLILWASWCLPCQKELIELTAHQKELEQAGIDVVALTVDGLNEDGSNPEDAPNFCKQKKIPFATGKATAELAQLLTELHHMMVVLNRPLPIPVSFLMNGKGQMTTIYKGPIPLAELLADVKQDPKNLRERWQRAACLPGSQLADDGLYVSLKRIDAVACYELAYMCSQSNRYQTAAEYFRIVLDAEPNYREAYPSLALSLDRSGQQDEAVRYYNEALKYYPERATLHYNLGAIYHRQGRRDQARLQYQEALRLDPKLTPARQALDLLQGTPQR
jgi:Flp pilus assembly protein TadD